MAKKYSKLYSNYILRKKHQITSKGTIWERDWVTIGAQHQIESGKRVFFADSGFLFTDNNFNYTKKKNNLGKIIAEGLTYGDVENATSIVNQVEVNRNSDDMRDFAYYGSCVELIRASVENIIKWFPANMKTQDYKQLLDSNTEDDAYMFENSFGIDLHHKNVDILDRMNAMRYMSSSWQQYNIIIVNKETKKETVYEIVNFEIGDFDPEYLKCPSAKKWLNQTVLIITVTGKAPCKEPLHIYIELRPTLDGLCYFITEEDNTVIIQPKEEVIEEYFKSLDGFEKQLLTRKTSPLYKNTFITPVETEFGYKYVWRDYIWPSDGYCIIIDDGDYYTYIDRLTATASKFDELWCDNLWNHMTHESIKNYDWTYSREYTEGDEEEFIEGGNRMEELTRIYGRVFDDIKRYIDGIKLSANITYDGLNNMPEAEISDKLNYHGWDIFSTIPDFADPETVIGGKYTKNWYSCINEDYITAQTEDLQFIRQLYLSAKYILQSKGTRNAIDMVMALFGIGPKDYTIEETYYTTTPKAVTDDSPHEYELGLDNKYKHEVNYKRAYKNVVDTNNIVSEDEVEEGNGIYKYKQYQPAYIDTTKSESVVGGDIVKGYQDKYSREDGIYVNKNDTSDVIDREEYEGFEPACDCEQEIVGCDSSTDDGCISGTRIYVNIFDSEVQITEDDYFSLSAKRRNRYEPAYINTATSAIITESHFNSYEPSYKSNTTEERIPESEYDKYEKAYVNKFDYTDVISESKKKEWEGTWKGPNNNIGKYINKHHTFDIISENAYNDYDFAFINKKTGEITKVPDFVGKLSTTSDDSLYTQVAYINKKTGSIISQSEWSKYKTAYVNSSGDIEISRDNHPLPGDGYTMAYINEFLTPDMDGYIINQTDYNRLGNGEKSSYEKAYVFTYTENDETIVNKTNVISECEAAYTYKSFTIGQTDHDAITVPTAKIAESNKWVDVYNGVIYESPQQGSQYEKLYSGTYGNDNEYTYEGINPKNYGEAYICNYEQALISKKDFSVIGLSEYESIENKNDYEPLLTDGINNIGLSYYKQYEKAIYDNVNDGNDVISEEMRNKYEPAYINKDDDSLIIGEDYYKGFKTAYAAIPDNNIIYNGEYEQAYVNVNNIVDIIGETYYNDLPSRDDYEVVYVNINDSTDTKTESEYNALPSPKPENPAQGVKYKEDYVIKEYVKKTDNTVKLPADQKFKEDYIQLYTNSKQCNVYINTKEPYDLIPYGNSGSGNDYDCYINTLPPRDTKKREDLTVDNNDISTTQTLTESEYDTLWSTNVNLEYIGELNHNGEEAYVYDEFFVNVPIKDITYNNKRYVIPYFDDKKHYDGEFAFQTKGGWGKQLRDADTYQPLYISTKEGRDPKIIYQYNYDTLPSPKPDEPEAGVEYKEDYEPAYVNKTNLGNIIKETTYKELSTNKTLYALYALYERAYGNETDIEDVITKTTYVIKSDTSYIETMSYLNVVSNVKSLLNINPFALKDHDIVYVVSIADYADVLEITPDTPSHFFYIKNAEKPYNISSWGNVSMNINDEDFDEALYNKANYLYNIISTSVGNNPHVGFGYYDEGIEYKAFMEQPFKYSLDNDTLDDDIRSQKSAFQYTLIEQAPETELESKIKILCDTISTFEDRDEVVGDSATEKIIDVTGGENYIINCKKMALCNNIDISKNNKYRQYFYNVILQYIMQVIPSTAILNLKNY